MVKPSAFEKFFNGRAWTKHNDLVSISHEHTSKAQLRTIQTFLGTSSLPDEHQEKLEGSCEWIDGREDFREWMDAIDDLDFPNRDENYSPSIYWVNASPGAGKIVLAKHVVSQLEEFRLQHASYHFHVGKKDPQALASFLRSIAYQIATSNAAVRDTVAKLCNDGSTFDQDDSRTIWSKVFRAGILQVCSNAMFYN